MLTIKVVTLDGTYRNHYHTYFYNMEEENYEVLMSKIGALSNADRIIMRETITVDLKKISRVTSYLCPSTIHVVNNEQWFDLDKEIGEHTYKMKVSELYDKTIEVHTFSL